MKNDDVISRRKFFKKSTLGIGLVGTGMARASASSSDKENSIKLTENISPREALVLSVTKEKIDPNEDILEQMIERMEITSSYKPDIICLPEVFATAVESAESLSGPISKKFSAYAKEHNCYIICPLYTKRENKTYNTAVLIDRKGDSVGMYDKIHPTENECNNGVTPGDFTQPVFKTDFGTIGILICFDVNWMDAWKKLKEQGAEIVFWTAAYPGGRMLSSYAWMFQYYVVGCSWRDPALIYDMTGDLIAKSGRYEHWALASLNLEKIHCEIDFHVKKVKEIRKKYGRKVRIQYYHDEDWVTIESRSHDLKIKQLIDEFGLTSHWDYIKRAEKYQDKFR